MENLSFNIEVFEGPLDLLLHLISKNKIDITDVPIALILDQYMEYITKMQQMDLNVASEFISMAAQLMLIKSKMLLPKPEIEEEDPRAQLIESLLEYQRFKSLSNDFFKPRNEYGRDIIEKPMEQIKNKSEFSGSYLPEDLLKSMQEIVERASRSLPPPIDSFAGLVGREVAPVEDKITALLELFKQNKTVSFTAFIKTAKTRSEAIACFLAILDLSKNNSVLIKESDDDYLIEINMEKTQDGIE